MKSWTYLWTLFFFLLIISSISFLRPGFKLLLITGASVIVFVKIFNEQEPSPPNLSKENIFDDEFVSMQRVHVDAPREHIMSEGIYGSGYHHTLGVAKPEYAGEIQQQQLGESNLPSSREILRHLLVPDLYEILIFVFSIVLTYLIFVPLFRIPPNAYSVLIAYAGIMMTMLYFTRWGYSSIFHFLQEQEKAIEKLMELEQNEEEKNLYVFNLKIIGILVSLVFLTVGFYLN